MWWRFAAPGGGAISKKFTKSTRLGFERTQGEKCVGGLTTPAPLFKSTPPLMPNAFFTRNAAKERALVSYRTNERNEHTRQKKRQSKQIQPWQR